MNDRYLFRGKSKDDWVMGFYRETQGFNDTTLQLIHSIQLGCEDYEIDLATLGQCTGLKDKNGKLIFEGDIIKDERGKIGQVHYLPQECGYVVALSERDYRLGHRNRGYQYHDDFGLEVIDNVHDNSELLEGAGA